MANWGINEQINNALAQVPTATTVVVMRLGEGLLVLAREEFLKRFSQESTSTLVGEKLGARWGAKGYSITTAKGRKIYSLPQGWRCKYTTGSRDEIDLEIKQTMREARKD